MAIRKYILGTLLLLILAVIPARGEGRGMSESSFVSVLTCGPGADLYSSWGHTAIRVCDPAAGIDEVFNYGTFNSSQEGFFLKFLKGDLLYHQSISTPERFANSYARENRVVWEQKLDLTGEQKDEIYAKLLFDSREENRYYKYNYAEDNCTTRVVDVVDMFLPGGHKVERGEASFRHLMNSVLYRWELRMTLNVLMGWKGDRVFPAEDFNCLPDIYMASLDNTVREDGTPLVSARNLVVDGRYTPSRLMFWLFPSVLLALLLVYVFIPRHRSAYLKGLLAFVMFITGVLGLVSVFLWSVGFHLAGPNINLLWIMPLNFFLMPFIFTRPRFRHAVVTCNLLLTMLTIVLVVFGVQGIEFQSAVLMLFVFMTYCLCWTHERKISRNVRLDVK